MKLCDLLETDEHHSPFDKDNDDSYYKNHVYLAMLKLAETAKERLSKLVAQGVIESVKQAKRSSPNATFVELPHFSAGWGIKVTPENKRNIEYAKRLEDQLSKPHEYLTQVTREDLRFEIPSQRDSHETQKFYELNAIKSNLDNVVRYLVNNSKSLGAITIEQWLKLDGDEQHKYVELYEGGISFFIRKSSLASPSATVRQIQEIQTKWDALDITQGYLKVRQ